MNETEIKLQGHIIAIETLLAALLASHFKSVSDSAKKEFVTETIRNFSPNVVHTSSVVSQAVSQEASAALKMLLKI